MPPDALARKPMSSWLDELFGTGELPPVRFSMYLDLPGEEDEREWEVRSFVLDERLHAPYALAVRARALGPALDLDAVLGARVVFEITRGAHARSVHGVVLEAELVRGVEGLGDEPAVELHVVPALALLGLSRRSRVFQGLSVVAIALAVLGPVLAEHGGSVCVDRLGQRRYEPRDYCVQYRETDLDFVLRILASEGITVMFDHSTGVETVVLVDANEALPNAGREPLEEDDDQPPPRVPFVAERADELPIESIAAVGRQTRMRRRQWTATAWDWKARPAWLLRQDTRTDHRAADGEWWEADEGRPGEGERSDGSIVDDTRRRAQLQRLSDHATAMRLRARSNATIFRAGSVFKLLGAPDEEIGDTWVVTAVRHEGKAPPFSADGSASGATAVQYSNEIECQPLRQPVMPPRIRRPQVVGVQSAVVTGPAGEAIHTDQFGRVRVRMLWDEHEHGDQPTSCWLRVATPWAGDGFGGVFIPRVGTEVIVSFIDGDPDRPFCSACVHNGATMPPYALPEHQTRTVLRTRTVGGKGFNELSFEDARGEEEVFLHAQGNLREQVLAHHSTEVGCNQTLSVEGSRYARIGRGDSTITAGDHRHTVSGQVTEHYRKGYVLHVGETLADAGAPDGPKGFAIDVASGGYDLSTAESIVLRCGESRLELHPDRIVLHSPRISAECPRASLVLEDGAATLRAARKVELGAEVLAAVSTSMTAIKGPTCEIRGMRVDIEGQRVSIEASSRIDICTAGEVDIRGVEKVKLNC